MANGATRMALSEIELKKESGTAELNEELKDLNDKKMEKYPLKAGASEHNHSN